MKEYSPPVPVMVALETPEQRRVHDIVPVAIDVGPNLDALSDNALDGKAAAIDQRINIFDMESAANSGALDSLSCFVHGDAIDMELVSRFDCGNGDVPNIYRKPLAGHWFPGNVGVAIELSTAIFFLYLQNSRRSPTVICKRRAE